MNTSYFPALGGFAWLLLAFFAVWIAAKGFAIVQQYQRGVVFRLGRLHNVRDPGLRWIIPLVDRIRIIDVRTVTAMVEKQETITSDNVPAQVTAVIWYQVVDPVRSVVEVLDVDASVIQVALTSLRSIIGSSTLDSVLKDQETLADRMRRTIDEATEPWGVKVTRVEMRNIEIPESMMRAMAQEAEAQREKRARIIKAEAELAAAEKIRQASFLISENPAGLELRRMQMVTEVGAEQNTTTIVLMPSQFMDMAAGHRLPGQERGPEEGGGLKFSPAAVR